MLFLEKRLQNYYFFFNYTNFWVNNRVFRPNILGIQHFFVPLHSNWLIVQIKDIIGQNEVKQRLCLAAKEGRIPHAMLFSGPSGAGKLQMAIAYAQYLACPNRTESDSCGTCPSCLQYAKLQHPDLHFAYPIVKTDSLKDPVCDDYGREWRELILSEGYFGQDDWNEKMGADKKQAFIYEKESSEILRKLSLKSFGNGYKVMIIWLPEKMYGDVCANKILKILEEPPEKTLFILVSDEPHKLLSTILSRVQNIRFDRLSEQEIVSALREENDELNVEDALDYAHIASGSYLAARRQMRSAGETQEFFEWFVELMRNAWMVGHQQDYESLLKLRQWAITTISDSKVGREKQKAFLEYAQRQVRENYIANYGMSDIVFQTKDERNFSRRFAPFINEYNVERLMDQLGLAQRQIEQNGNPKMIFFDLCLQMIVMLK